MKLLQKLLLGFLGNSILLGFIGTVAISTNLHNKHHVTQLSKSSVKEFEAATQMNYALAAIQVNAHKLLFKDYSIAKSNNTNSTAKTAKIEIEYELNKFEEYLAYSKKATRSAIVLAQRNGFLAEYEQEKTELNMLKKLESEFLVHKKLIAQYLFLANENIAAEKFLYEDLEPHFQKSLLSLIQAYELDAKVELKAQAIEVLADIDGTTKLIGGVSVVAIAAAIFSGLFLSYSILKPIKTLTKAVGEISEGRLNTKVKVKSKDEIGVLANSFNQMVEHLNVTTVSKSYIDNIIKSVPDILIVADANAIITRTNKDVGHYFEQSSVEWYLYWKT